MHAIILFKSGKNIGEFESGLKYEGFNIVKSKWSPTKEITLNIFDADILVIYNNKIAAAEDDGIFKCIPVILASRPAIPIAVVDEKRHERTNKLVLELGADSYIGKPFRLRDLAMDFKKLIREKSSLNATRWLHYDDLWLDLEYRFAKRQSQEIRLRNKEFALLEYLIMNCGKLLTRNAIFDHVWDRNGNFASNTVDVHINRLRRKIDDPFDNKLIHTVHCVGYIFDKKQIEKEA